MSKKTVIFFAVFLLALNIFCWREVFALHGKQYLMVDFLDVGQGDSAFIETPQGHQIIIDGGPDSSLAGKLSSLVPFWDRTIDLVILSHPEKDHMQGLLDVLQTYKADYILWTGVKKTAPEYDAWMNVLSRQENLGAKIIIAEAGQEIKAGDVLIDTIYPLVSAEGQELKNTSNDTCVVSKIVFGESSFLFTGDISFTAEKEIINSDENILSDVLKVAHHGSKYSTSDLFLAAVAPRAAIVEVGKNSYGHPTSETLQRLENIGAGVLRTDQLGDITILSDGNNIYLK